MPSKPSFCPKMREILIESLEVAGVPHHKEAKTVTIEGPRFSTFAESELYRDVFRAQIVNMTTVPEGTDILFFFRKYLKLTLTLADGLCKGLRP